MLQASPQFNYDVFISYRSTQRDWAEMLANNLSAQGYKVFFDIWEIQAGQSFTRVIEEALRSSRMAILIATPEAADSGWVQREYELMLQLEREIPNFRFIPAVWGIFPDFPFLSNRHAVDFKTSTEGEYRTAFQQLLAALKQQAPGAKPYFSAPLELPQPLSTQTPVLAAKQRSFVESIFDRINRNESIMVLAQEGFNTQPYVQALKNKATERYGKNHFIHLFPPTSVDEADYFTRLANQSGIKGVIKKSWQWADAIVRRLENGQELFLLVTGFENGAEELQYDFAREVRNLFERHASDLHLVILGGEQLAKIKNTLNALSFMEEIFLPQLSLEDVKALYGSKAKAVSDEALKDILDFSGSYPRLFEACLNEFSDRNIEWRKSVQQGSLPIRLFDSLYHENIRQEKICESFGKSTFGRYSLWSLDILEWKLFWQGLLKINDDGVLVWRCDWLREVGKEILKCY
ncbi:MAG: toll/interleukin-1 receptor domain-containing protein [Thiolinea sp.]